jgi:hypothetical protein
LCEWYLDYPDGLDKSQQCFPKGTKSLRVRSRRCCSDGGGETDEKMLYCWLEDGKRGHAAGLKMEMS